MTMTEPTPPATPEQALAVVRARYARPRLPDGTPAELEVYEFDTGYLVYPASPPRATDAPGPPRPAPPGGAGIVVSKETGETVTVPNYPVEQAVAYYRDSLRRDPDRRPG
ncbi:hypothetical protein ACFV6E_03395 [Streptomyces sp. NPDC059785]|uniref:hypothetical protein n=1 Tax=unclassified Streptomyces TaxID=2593676 RepID=UPI00365CC96D